MNYKESIYLAYLDDPEEEITLQNFPSFTGGVPVS